MNRGTLKPILVITVAALAVALSLADAPTAGAGGASGGPGILGGGGTGGGSAGAGGGSAGGGGGAGGGGAGMVPKNAAVREIDQNALQAELEAVLTSAQKEKMKELMKAYADESATHDQIEKDLRDVSIPIRTLSIGLTLGSLYLTLIGANIAIPSNVIISQAELNFLKYVYEGNQLVGLPNEITLLYNDYTNMLKDIWQK